MNHQSHSQRSRDPLAILTHFHAEELAREAAHQRLVHQARSCAATMDQRGRSRMQLGRTWCCLLGQARARAQGHLRAVATRLAGHHHAQHQVKNGTKLDVVRQVLGHTSLATTSIYVSLAREETDAQLQEHAL